MIHDYLYSDIRYAPKEGVTHAVLHAQMVRAGSRETMMLFEQDRHLNEPVVLVSKPLSAVVSEVELNGIGTEAVADEEPHVLIGVVLRMPYVEHDLIRRIGVGNRVIEMPNRIHMPLGRLKRSRTVCRFKMAIDRVATACTQHDSEGDTCP